MKDRTCKGFVTALALTLAGSTAFAASPARMTTQDGPFRRVASFPVFLNTDEDTETVAEIVTSSSDGKLLIYTDGAGNDVGFVDITNPANPLPGGIVSLSGAPTSVSVVGPYALACVNTSADFVNTSGNLEVIDVATRTIVRTIALGGQPDAVTVSPDRRYAAIVIENERDEDFGDGRPPQAPPGFLVIVDLVGAPASWTTRVVSLVGLADLYPDDPEPEFVDINAANIAVVTLQENNHIVLVDLKDGSIVDDFSAGAVDLDQIDAHEDARIELVDSLAAVLREPDAVVWTSNQTFATANEGDLDGGSRGFTTWDIKGNILFDAGNELEHQVVRHGHYPEGRSESSGSEPEAVEYARFGRDRFLFVGCERAGAVLVYALCGKGKEGSRHPIFRQLLPTGFRPEGLHAIPGRNLFVASSEVDERGDKLRAMISIYERSDQPNYPTLVSALRDGAGTPIPWGALSGLVAQPTNQRRLYGIYDSFYSASRIFSIRTGDSGPAVIRDEIVLTDPNDVLLDSLEALKLQLPGTDDFDPASFINADHTVNLDLEGIENAPRGGFFLVSEGGGNLKAGVSDPDSQPFVGPNLLVHASADGTIEHVIQLPLELTKNQLRYGFEGVATAGHYVYVAFQRAWTDAGDPADRARIGRYDLKTGTWSFAYYPLDPPTSPNGGFVGLSELTALGHGRFAVIERDDQNAFDARVKRIYSFSIAGVSFLDSSQAPGFEVLTKSLVIDFIASNTYAVTGGPIPEKLEGFAVRNDRHAFIVNDNDGVDDNSGETQLLELVGLFD